MQEGLLSFSSWSLVQSDADTPVRRVPCRAEAPLGSGWALEGAPALAALVRDQAVCLLDFREIKTLL